MKEDFNRNCERFAPNWAQQGLCPVCGGYDGSYIVYGGLMGVCDKHKLKWWNSYWSNAADEMPKIARNEALLANYVEVESMSIECLECWEKKLDQTKVQ